MRDESDPHEPARIFTSGVFRGRCVDVRTVRPVRILSEDETAISVSSVYHDGRFWTGRIPKGAVTRALFQIIPFDSGVPLIQAAHTQFRFLLKNDAPIQLVAQSKSSKQTAQLTDVIVSSTFTAPEGELYKAVQGLRGGYGIVTRLLSSRARGFEEIYTDKSTVRQFEMKLSDLEKNQLFEQAIREASRQDYEGVYNLLKNNCTTIGFDVLDRVRTPPADVPPMRGNWWNLRDEFIEPSIEALKKRGLIDNASEIPPMNDEPGFQYP